jgi:hypothetical protein
MQGYWLKSQEEPLPLTKALNGVKKLEPKAIATG